jgi:O-succinylbenzoic acid--CoA ligase
MTLTINSKTYTLTQLPLLIKEKRKMNLPEWEETFFVFLENWFDETDTIHAQTSGSTGLPKNVELNKNQMRASALLTNQFFGLQPNNIALLCLSTNYIAGKMMIVRSLVNNLHLIVVEPNSCPILSEKINFAAMVPMQVEHLVKTSEGLKSISNIDKLIIGGSSISSVLETKIQTISTQCYATYGMTETVSHIALRKINGELSSDNYKALDGVRFEVDKRNCLVIYAPHLQHEPFITNDIVEIISDTEFKWLGRYDNVINTGSVKISPEIIENKISNLLTERFYFTGLKDIKLGEKVVLIIESEPFDEVKINNLKEQLLKVLNKFEFPREIIFKTHFDETNSGKVKRIN